MTALNYLVVLAVDLSRPLPRTTVPAASPVKGEGPPTSVHGAHCHCLCHNNNAHDTLPSWEWETTSIGLINTQLRRVSILFSLVALNMTGYTQQSKNAPFGFLTGSDVQSFCVNLTIASIKWTIFNFLLQREPGMETRTVHGNWDTADMGERSS